MSATLSPAALAARAAEIVARVARGLADPGEVTAITGAAVDVFPDGEVPIWYPGSLNEGPLGVALLHAELGDRAAAHAHLSGAARFLAGPEGARGRSLLTGLPALLFATRAAVTRPGDYASLLARIEPQVRAMTRGRAAEERELPAAGPPGTRFTAYDVIEGLTGLGRLVLPYGDTEALTYLVALTEPIELNGARVPGWWVRHAPIQGRPDGGGHFNLGLAHGIAGPLALLALAHRDGARPPGLVTAVERIAGWLLGWESAGGWPFTVTPCRQAAGPPAPGPPARPGWCYGTGGIARALYLAGTALDRPDWRAAAVLALRRALEQPLDEWGMTDAGLCHGWAGILHVTCLIARESGDPLLAAGADALAGRLMECFEPDAPFGFRYAVAGEARMAPDRAGLLDGATGIALALHHYATGTAPATGWDAALLLN
ncbi:hypothetical protein Sru01_49820 [Sphaerisporangium rufum]|uniref:Lanthionine synthetase C-like protein n=1 Tax=Sphaerisporangium rufum TaxID=1381558 RepID=A0A919R9W1_9ACTN|nr:lanthionine synthetase C family protein [Sphaerisporangium rufum]GII80000.1 hypothetical protein Sru01_49820 [Sphaerisporangium rufum]